MDYQEINFTETTRQTETSGSWVCSECGEIIEEQFEECWKCSKPDESEIKEKPDGLFARFFSALILLIGGFFLYAGFFGMFLNGEIDGFGVFFLLIGIAVTLAGTAVRGWEKRWKIWGVMSIVIGIIVPLITISTVSTLSANPDMAGRLAKVSTVNCALMGAVLVGSGLFLIRKHIKLQN